MQEIYHAVVISCKRVILEDSSCIEFSMQGCHHAGKSSCRGVIVKESHHAGESCRGVLIQESDIRLVIIEKNHNILVNNHVWE